MSLRVLIISHMYPNQVNPVSGIFVHNQAKSLQKAGIRVRVVSPIPRFPLYPKWKGYRKMALQTRLEGIDVQYVPTLMFPGGFFFSNYGRFYTASLQQAIPAIQREFPFDLIHAHTIFPDGYAAGILKRSFQVPVVSTIHGSDIMLYPKRNKSVYRKTLQALQMNDRIITVSGRLLAEAERMAPGIEAKTIYNGFDPSRFYPIRQQKAREQLGISGRKKVLLFVGNLLPVKGVDLLLTAFAKVAAEDPDLHLYLVGDGPLRRTLAEQSARQGIQAQTHFMGRRPYEEIPAWINSADALVLASRSEGLPSILLESMGCGKPMVCTDVGGIAEILRDGETGFLVEPGNTGQLAERLRQILVESPELARSMGERAFQMSKALTWEQNAQNTIQLYEQVLAVNGLKRDPE
ncbi:glycosyltransferase family 4 protein [Lihuaxuella thermophila]|uniref:Glycosyltransferase involved in cell wall bisynthesis n=1 Tax=Lihuaxuella thermophila TaxID=1173111 RepID=A0A1H8B836_9BACL|nr:glycosyltransferase family 4 protein [Lihuaxuella thermophila]SEM79131.1 Glycosyltransferase involved in cell wall bisynthesis [Lihuaxuella thermophila]